MNLRNSRLEQEIGKRVSSFLTMHFPRYLVSVVRVELQEANRAVIFISIFGEERNKIFKEIKKSKSEMRRSLSSLSLRVVPNIVFSLDNSMETSQNMSNILKNIKE